MLSKVTQPAVNQQTPSEQSPASTLPSDAERQSNQTPEHEKSTTNATTHAQDKSVRAAEVDVSSFPEGGAKAWLSVLGCFFIMIITFGWLQSVGVYQAYYELNQLSGYSHDEVAWVVSTQAFCLFAGGLVVGPLHDKRGPRVLLWGGTFLHVFGLFMTSLATKYYQFLLAQGFCSGIGTAMLFYPSLACVASWFRTKRATAIGIAASGSGLGGVFFPLIVREMIYDSGFGWTMRTCAFLVLFLGIIASLITTSRLPPAPKKATKDDFKFCLNDTTYCLVVAAGATMFTAMWLVFTFIVITAISRGVETNWAFYLVPILNAASTFGRLIPGYLADKTGSINMFAIMVVFTFSCMTGLWIPVSGQAGMIAFSVLFGFGSGALNSLAPAVIAQISDVRMLGLRTGLCYSFSGIGCLMGSPAGGAIIEASGYKAMQGFAGALAATATLLTLFIRYRVAGFDLRKKI